ncbi:D,D-dipeptide ABC transporter permease [Pseudaminobacter sp. 19-2017]|uniref:D,D-dipeptide ABC transporter permease n=1 Tax=Pseudaminobacter soli (ex Zhang et al. 2022) TaxID=2831468 RepID=A0A942E1K9_9HYPH|nr:D,D-dipeptide ABC transporter permease [Pseudaminobacter soli]
MTETDHVDWAGVFYRIRQQPQMIVGMIIVALVLCTMVFAPWIAPYEPTKLDILNRLAPPSGNHWFGTDQIGRDIFSRVIYGSRISVTVGLGVVLLAMRTGAVIGAFSGLAGGKVDTAIMRIMDVMLSFPSFVMAIALASALGPSLTNAMLAIAVLRIPFYVRLARGQALSLRERSYVKAAETFGSSRIRIVWRHIVPNALPPILVQAMLDIGAAILTASALSFIGLGAQEPAAEWGAMVATGRNFLLDQWWFPTFPGLAILTTAIGFNLFGDGLREIFDPRAQGR